MEGHGHWLYKYLGKPSGGSGGGCDCEPLIIRFDIDRSEVEEKELYDKTWQQVFDALDNGIPVYAESGWYDSKAGEAVKDPATLYPCVSAYVGFPDDASRYKVSTPDTEVFYVAVNPSDYLRGGASK